MAKTGSALRAILACAFFGGTCGALLGAALGGLTMLVTLLAAAGQVPVSFPEIVLVALVLLSLGVGYGFLLGAFAGAAAGSAAGSAGRPAAWMLGGLAGGYAAGLFPAAWFPWPLELVDAAIGLMVGTAIALAVYVGESTFSPLNQLIRILERSEVNAWPRWRRWALALVLLLLFGTIARVLSVWASAPMFYWLGRLQ